MLRVVILRRTGANGRDRREPGGASRIALALGIALAAIVVAAGLAFLLLVGAMVAAIGLVVLTLGATAAAIANVLRGSRDRH